MKIITAGKAREFPRTETCTQCGAVIGDILLSDLDWVVIGRDKIDNISFLCPSCGLYSKVELVSLTYADREEIMHQARLHS